MDATEQSLIATEPSNYEEDPQIMLDLLKTQTEEYLSETERMKAIINSVGLNSASRHSKEDEQIENLVDFLSTVAMDLGVDDLSEVGLSLALSDLRMRVSKLPVENLRQTRRQDKFKEDNLEGIQSLGLSEEALKKAETENSTREDEILQMKKKIIFLSEKQKEYQRCIDKYSTALKMSGYRKEFTHDAIVELKTSLDKATQNELKPLKSKLESYKGLPPNKDLARAKISEAEKELNDLAVALTKEISALHV